MEPFFRRFTRLGPRAKRLAFEALERRDLLTVMRLVDWNTLNGPNVAFDADFTTILEAIGNETVQGNTKRIDILALQETDSVEGSDSIGKIEAILDNLYMSSGADYTFSMTTLDGGGDRTGFVYDTSTVELLATSQIDLTHNILRGKFRPLGTSGDDDFYVYTVHLSSSGGASVRQDEAATLRADADSLPEGTSILVVGDFNLEGSSEGAWTQLVTIGGAGQLQDVANAPGEWHDNVAFKSLHSQDPVATPNGMGGFIGGMDDRFDIQFASGEWFDDVGLEYIDGSYHVFGNNGTHTLNRSIDTGTGASPAVLAALIAASDHLPVVADYEFTSGPNVHIRETGGQTKAVEGGVFDVYSVVLDTVPSANVTITVTPDAQVDVGAGAGVAMQLVFTPANALTPQTVVVNAVDDLIGEGNHSGLISHTSTSTDLDYDAFTIGDVVVAIIDNDAPVIVINELDSDTIGTDMLEFVELYDGGVGNVSLDSLSLVFFNGNLTGDPAYEVYDLTGYFTDPNGFFVLGNAGIGSRDITFSNSTLQNGADAVALYSGSFTLGNGPTTTNLLDAVVYDTDDADDTGLLVLLEAGQPQVNEDGNNNKDFDAIARVPDHGTPRTTETYVAQAPTPDALNAPPTPGYLLVQSGTRVDVEEGGLTDNYQLSLQTFPTDDVTITVDPDDQLDLGAGPGAAIMLTFTPANAIIPQTITVAAVDDVLVEGDHTGLITHSVASADLAYDGLVIGDVVASIVDNDAPAAQSIVITEIMYNPTTSESGPPLPEWIEVANTGAGPVDLEGWFFADEDTSWGAVPAGTILQPSQVAVFFDTTFTSAATFRAEWSVPANALVVGVSWGALANTPSDVNEILELKDDGGVQMDLLNYDDASPWPSDPGGPSIYLTNPVLDNNAGGSWALSSNGVNRAHTSTGPTFSTSDVGSPGYLPVSADFNFDGEVSGDDFLAWQRGFGTIAPNALKSDGDADSDLDVDSGDLGLWEAAYGTVVPLVAPVSVPLASSGDEPPEPLGAVALAADPFPANVFLALPTVANQEVSAEVEDDTPLLSTEVVDTALTAGENLVIAPRSSIDELLLTDGGSDGEDAADEAFADWDELSLAL